MSNWDDASGRRYVPLADGRIPLWVLLSVGDEALAVTPWHGYDNPMRLSAGEIARDCEMPANEVVGREFTAVGDENELHDFRLVHDPRK
ncbi:hypothetical protein [Nocardia sp. NPDC052566]|uniref:hypothetical protein n=1 Tax=Nocardia sp. NPDC052566 TaxID=3364330 RepID=UPI0037CC8B5E